MGLNPLEDYLDKYCKQNKVSREETRKHALVKEVEAYYQKCKCEVIANDSSFMRKLPRRG